MRIFTRFYTFHKLCTHAQWHTHTHPNNSIQQNEARSNWNSKKKIFFCLWICVCSVYRFFLRFICCNRKLQCESTHEFHTFLFLRSGPSSCSNFAGQNIWNWNEISKLKSAAENGVCGVATAANNDLIVTSDKRAGYHVGNLA